MNRVMSSARVWLVIAMLVPLDGLAQTAELQPSRVREGDVVTLVIEYQTHIPALYALDTSVLRQDFEILDAQSSTIRQPESEKYSSRMQWKLQILPVTTGVLKIPAMKLGDGLTPPLELEVIPLALQERDKITVTQSAYPTDPYPGQQIMIAQRLTHVFPVYQGEWLEPEINQQHKIIHLDESYSGQLRGSTGAEVLERRLVLFPDNPGKLTIPPSGYQALVHNAQALENGSLPNGGMKKIYRESASLTLTVKDIPAGFTGSFWLPASKLRLTQHWVMPKILQVGDTLERTLTIVAEGLPEPSLPRGLFMDDIDGIKVYPDQARYSSSFGENGVVSQIEQLYAIVLLRPGMVHLPELRLRWWDVGLDEEREAVLPGNIINVAEPVVDDQNGAGSEFSAKDMSGRSMASIQGLWVLLATALLAVGCWYGPGIRVALIDGLKEIRMRLSLYCICASNDAPAARSRLILWARARWPDLNILGLRQIDKNCVGPELITELSALDSALYSYQQKPWRGKELWRWLRMEPIFPRTQEASGKEELSGLYPRSTPQKGQSQHAHEVDA